MPLDAPEHTAGFRALCREHGVSYENMAVIAFDVFDTLLYRTISPRQVYERWAEALIEALSLKKTPSQVLKARFLAARMAKLRPVLTGKDREAKYGEMAGIMRVMLGVTCGKQSFLDTCLRLELEVERAVTYVPEERRALLQSALDTGKKVVCISDFYLPEEVLRALLAHHGICPAQLFVSETYALQKATGRLYGKVAEMLQCDPSSILMIGDNRRSDFEAARSKGLQAIWLDSSAQMEFYRRRNEEEAAARAAFFQRLSGAEPSKPFAAVAYPMVLFIQRLYGALRRDGCRHVLFLSREGEFFKKLFDAYQEQWIAPDERVISHYFYASRRATLLPSVFRSAAESFSEIFKNYPSMSILTFLKNLGLDAREDLLEALGADFDLQREIPLFSKSKELDAVVHNALFVRTVLEKAARQRELLVRYLDSMDPDYRNSGLFLVDIGYSGTSQNQIFKALEGQVSVHGYYLISNPDPATVSPANQKTGILYDSLAQSPKDAFAYNPVMLEAVFMASHGAVEEYAERDGKVVPVLHEDHREKACYQAVAAPIQETIFEAFSQWIALIRRGGLSEHAYFRPFLKGYRKFIFNPTEAEIRSHMGLVVIDNFSVFCEKRSDAGARDLGGFFSFRSLVQLVRTRGWCLNQQGTNWMAAAFYKLNLRCMNILMLRISGITMTVYDRAVRRAARRRQQKK